MSSPDAGVIVGVFGADPTAKSQFEAAVAKKSEAEGVIVYHRVEGGRKISLLDTADFPERIQGYARIASIADHAFFVFPNTGKLTSPDGELAVLIEAFDLQGTLQIMDGSTNQELAVNALKGTKLARFWVEERDSKSSVLDVTRVVARADFPSKGNLVYIDRAFSVKGVGTVALGFVLSGRVSIHDQLRPIPGGTDIRGDVKGIQINDQDHDSAGRGIRVGLSLRGIEPKELEESRWLDDGSFQVADSLSMNFAKSAFYKQDVQGRDLHLQLPGETLPAKLSGDGGGTIRADLPVSVPAWKGMKVAVLDLNAKPLRVAGSGTVKL